MLKLTKRGVQVCLGLLWLLDGALQLQHQMFSSAFATQVITPAAAGQPGFVSGPMHFGMHLFLHSPIIFNSLFALTQLGLGVLILSPRTRKLGLLSSVLWSLVVWIFGEGYGGIFSGHTLLLMGAPGAVIIYAILALAALPKEHKEETKPRHQTAYWLVLVWCVLWVGGSIYQLLPGQNSTSDVSSMISGMAEGAPGYLASIDNHTANLINDFGKTDNKITICNSGSSMNMTSAQMSHMSNESCTSTKTSSGYWFILIVSALQLCIGIGVFFSGIWRKLAVSLGIIVSLIFWVVGQGLGGYYTGLATDPSTGPLFVILGLAILSIANLDMELTKLGKKIEHAMIGGNNTNKKTKVIKPA